MMIHVVLGMHKSGTTLVSELLHHAGIDMVDAASPDTGYDEGNKWERESTKQVNHAILGSAGAHYWASSTGRRRLTVFRHCLPRWCDSNAAILSALDLTTQPFIVIDYAWLMTDPAEFLRLERFVGRPLSDRRDPRMRRSRATRSVGYRAARAWYRLRGGGSPEAIADRLDECESERFRHGGRRVQRRR